MASLLDEWAREEETTSSTPAAASSDVYGRGGADDEFEEFDEFDDDGIDFGDDDGVLVGRTAAGSSSSSGRQQQQQDMFSLDLVEREVARGRGAITAVAASADAVVVVTSRAYLLRYDVASGGPPVEVELVPASARSFSSSSASSAASPSATGVWLDPASGSHAVVAVDGLNGNNSSGALYVHARWRKPRALSLTGVGGGGSSDAAPSSSSLARLSGAAFDEASVTESNTGPVLFATSAGVLSSFSFDERDKREKSSGRKLYSFGGSKSRWGPVGGVALARTADGGGGKRLALVATAERLFVFSAQLSSSSRQSGAESNSSLEPLFSTCSPDPADLTNFLGATAAFASSAALGDNAADVEGAGGVALVAPLPGAPPDRFVWLSRAGLVSGSLDSVLECASAAAAGGGGGGSRSSSSGASGLIAAPLSPQRSLGPFSSSSSSRPLVATRFHAVVVDGARALAFNLVSGALVQALVPGAGGAAGGAAGGSDVFSAAAAATAAANANAAASDGDDDDDFAPPAHLLPPRPLAADAASGAVYLVSAEGCLLEASPTGDEGRDAWRAHLARGDFRAAAAAAADDAAARDAVSRAEASSAFSSGDLMRAARLYGRTLSKGSPTFEEVALRFMDSGDREALMLLLDSRLEALQLQHRRAGRGGSASSPSALQAADTTAQAAALAAWLAELHLDACNREELVSEAAASGGGGGASKDKEQQESKELEKETTTPARTALRTFLESHADSLDVGVAVGLLAGYGRVDDLLFYAKLRGDAEAVVEHVLSAAASAARRGDTAAASAAARAAVGALRAPGVPRELAYKFAPALFDLCPAEAVDAWLRADPPLAPAKLLPALAHAVDGGGGGESAAEKGASASSASSSSSSTAEARAAALRYVLTVLDGGGGGGGGAEDEDDEEDGDDDVAFGSNNTSNASKSGLSALHNLAVALLADPRAGGEDAEDALLDFLARVGKRRSRRKRSSSRNGISSSYDPCLALAAARKGRRRRAAVALLQELGEVEAAVEEALAFDPALAAALAAAAPLAPAGDAAAAGSSSAGARRRAALSVARALIAVADPSDPSAAVDAVDGFLRACAEAAAGGGSGGKTAAAFGGGGASSFVASSSTSTALLSLEDVLPLFPDTTCLGALKPAVLRSLDEADARARASRSRARDAAEAADAARRDLRALRGRRGTVSAAALCARCGAAVGRPPPTRGPLPPSNGGNGNSLISRVYLYPTGNAYHGSCAAEALAEALPAAEATVLRRRAADAAAGKRASSSSSSPGGRRSVDEELRSEDPCCGERAVASLGVPLVDPVEDAEALALWRV